MKYSILYNINSFATAILLFCACSDEILPSETGSMEQGNIITVGADVEGLEVSSTVTRAAGETRDAETVSWLVQPLMKGLDITYGYINSSGAKQNERVAILKLVQNDDKSDGALPYKTNAESGFAEYTFKYRADNGDETNELARWYENGLHYFEGVHVPNRIRYNAFSSELASDRTINSVSVKAVPDFTTDQSEDIKDGTDNDLSNYYLLSHYLGMPANTQISATVGRIKLPFRHRLARVLAYILIDPELMHNGNPAKIEGYANIETDSSKPFRDDPKNSSIRFCNVDVLEGVHDVYNSETKLHTLTPIWAEKVRKVIPHFTEQIPSFTTYETDKKTYYQGSSEFPTSKPAGSREVVYHNVPVYDLIVRPTYTSAENVMYDEDLGGMSEEDYAKKTNKIKFTVSLNNGLTYEKDFEFELDANYQTYVYLKITRKGVDYNESGSQLWEEKTQSDLWYGVDNQNGHTLSKAGSSWQRAYYNTRLNSDDKITDGGFYDENTTGEDGTSGQYVSDATWIKNFAQAYEGGAHHGDYFVLANDITIDARSLPDDFVFTGHLDGFNTHSSRGYHTITVTDMGEDWKEYIPTTDYTSNITRYDTKPAEYSNEFGHVFALPELYTKTHYEDVYYSQTECNTHNATLPEAWKPDETVKEQAVVEEKYTQQECDEENAKHLVADKNGKNPGEDGYIQTYESGYTEITTADIKTPGKDAVYYSQTECDEHNATLNGARTTSMVKTEAYDEYNSASPSLNDIMTGTTVYYTKSGENDYTQYVKPAVLYTMVQRKSGTSLFIGLNGIYDTKQERADNPNSVIWEANVHKEGNFWLPYRDISDSDATKHTGWRAEVMNLNVIGCDMFEEGAKITGFVQNCSQQASATATKVMVSDHTPAYPKYK